MSESTVEAPGAGKHAVLTGPIQGSVELGDGASVDVSPQVVYLDTPEQAEEVAAKVGQRYATEGHPNVPVSEDNPDGFVLADPPQEG